MNLIKTSFLIFFLTVFVACKNDFYTNSEKNELIEKDLNSDIDGTSPDAADNHNSLADAYNIDYKSGTVSFELEKGSWFFKSCWTVPVADLYFDEKLVGNISYTDPAKFVEYPPNTQGCDVVACTEGPKNKFSFTLEHEYPNITMHFIYFDTNTCSTIKDVKIIINHVN